MYHRIVGDLALELDLPFSVFCEQMAWLSQLGGVVSYTEAISLLEIPTPPSEMKYVITFDDAYEDFYTHALPVLRELRLPATIFVPTRFIDEPEHIPLSRKPLDAKLKIRPMSWDQLREVAADPLITIGAHTHNHPELVTLSEAEIANEMRIAAGRFDKELGFVPVHFAYPRGIWDDRVRGACAPYCVSACTTNGNIATPRNSTRYAIPRVPIRRSDGMRWFEDRVQGRLSAEEQLIRMAKRALGRNVGY
jgi:peptidoglycan/xylan/chitin deacetylase (PgdA/CDA1 family)